jgi:membrane protein YqaA with SNARE-associated domain
MQPEFMQHIAGGVDVTFRGLSDDERFATIEAEERHATGFGYWLMMNVLFQNASRGRSIFSTFRHFGAAGLFFLAILDSSPVPTFGGPDILLAILVAARRGPWYEYAAAAMVGSTIGAYITFRLARKAGQAYLDSKFGHARVAALLGVFKKWGTGSLIATTAIPFPFPTSLVFAAAGASDYHLGTYLVVVASSRGARYAVIGILADLFGRHFVRMFRHPTQYWGWFLVFGAAVLALIAAGILINKRLLAAVPAR